MSIVRTNQPNWFGTEAAPVQNGYIYVGQPNQDPRQFPQTVTFTDSIGNSFTAAQPLRTNSEGQIQWNGKAIIADVANDYSLLILDSNQTQVAGGYIPVVDVSAAGGSTDLSDYRAYSLVLADLKKLDVAPGQTVGGIGKLSTSDGLGADWLVISNTGSPGDDIDLIDFDNGLQGVRLRNFLQPKDNLDNLGDIATARLNLDVYSKTEIDDGFQVISSEVANYTKAESIYVADDSANANVLSVGAAVSGELVWESFGPTGSGADNVWTALNDLPSGSKFIDVMADCNESVGTPATLSVQFYARATGSTAGFGNTTKLADIRNSSGSITMSYLVPCRIAVDDNGIFEAAYNSNGGGGSVVLVLRGFGV